MSSASYHEKLITDLKRYTRLLPERSVLVVWL